MAIDGPTLLLLSLGLAAVIAGFMALEWRVLREPPLLYWAAGYAAIVVGCAIAPLREDHEFAVGLWAADGLLIVAHLLFLFGVARFSERRVSPSWWGLLVPWTLLLVLPNSDAPLRWLAVLNAGLVAIAALRTGALVTIDRPARSGASQGAPWIGVLFLAHGAFYCLKTALAFELGAFAGILAFKGFIIQVSLLEGSLVEVALALLMARAVRRRREARIADLADRDSLTDVLNRRAFEARAQHLLAAMPAGRRLGALLLLDIDHFKSVNDSFGHAIGDDTLVGLTTILQSILPRNGVIGRFGGDEFVVLLPDAAPALVGTLGDAICGEFARLNRYFRDMPVAATVSIGAALIAEVGPDLDRLMAAADAAAYQAKRRGRDQIYLQSAA